MVLGKNCELHRGCFGVWPNEPCPYHDVSVSDNTAPYRMKLTQAEGEDIMYFQEELLLEDITHINADVRIFHSLVLGVKTASLPKLKKAVYLSNSNVGREFKARASYIQANDSCVFTGSVHVSSPDATFRECTFLSPVILDSDYPVEKSYRFYDCTFNQGGPQHLSFQHNCMVWWEEE